MDSQSDSLSFSPFDSQDCVILGIWILDVVHDGLCVFMYCRNISKLEVESLVSEQRGTGFSARQKW